MVVRLQDGSGRMASPLQMNLPMVESGETLVTAVAGVRPEPGVNVAMDSPLDTRLETFRAEITEEPFLLMGSHDVIVELQLVLTTVRTDFLSLRRAEFVHPTDVGLEIGLAGKHSLAVLASQVFRVEFFMNPPRVVLQLPVIVSTEGAASGFLWTSQGACIVNLVSVLLKLSDPLEHEAAAQVTAIHDFICFFLGGQPVLSWVTSSLHSRCYDDVG